MVTEKSLRDKLSQINAKILGTKADPFHGAPAVLIVLADKNIPTYIYDGSLVMGNMLNAAFSEGLGSCWVHRAKEMFNSVAGDIDLSAFGNFHIHVHEKKSTLYSHESYFFNVL